jgi:predicted ATPase
VTFLFTDVEGSTTLLRELGSERYAEELARHRRVVREVVGRHGGVQVDTQGDEFFVAFASARSAARAAVETQDALAAGRIRVRIGLHTGEALPTDAGYVGLDVHRAARIAAVAHGGQVVLSSSTRQLLDADVGVSDLGEHRLKDLSAPERLYQLGATRFPPLKTLYQTNLPVPSTAFLGRDRELAEVTTELQREDVRLLTLTGPGGTGKTRLALQAAAVVSDHYADGVWWVPLASVREPQLVLAQASRVIGSRNGLADRVGDRRMLLLFDNFEHLSEAAGSLGDLLAVCPNLKLLVTSRELLRLSAEREYPVPPLEEREALRLFQERAFGEQPSGTVASICRRLDCLPLAVELAAARTPVLSAQQILDRLQQRLSFLTRAARDAPERQQTLRATIDWSYSLLNDDEQRLFSRLAVFSGGCTLEAAEQVVGADLDTLQSLVEKNLLRHTEDRLWMLETIREYAAEMLGISGETDALAGRHATFFAELIAQADRQLDSPDEKRMRQRVAPEAANVVAATRWAHHRRNAELLLQLARGGEALSLPPAQQIQWIDEALSLWTGPTTPLLARGYYSAGGLHLLLNELKSARARLERATSLYRELGDRDGEVMALRLYGAVLGELGEIDAARATLDYALDLAERGDGKRSYAILHHLGELEAAHGQPQKAAQHLQQAIESARREGDLAASASALHGLGDVHLAQHDLTLAGNCYLEALAIECDFRQPRGCAYCLRGLAAVAALRQQAERAALLWGAADTVEQESGYTLLARTRKQYELAVAELAGTHFDVNVAKGRQMTLDDAVAYATRP